LENTEEYYTEINIKTENKLQKILLEGET